jgi:hypothetical protein
MTSRVVVGVALACAFVSCAAAAGTGPPPVALTASPVRLTLAGGGSRHVLVTNPGRAPVVVHAAPAGYTLDLRGRPRIVALRTHPWVAVWPHRVLLRAGATAGLSVSASVPHGAVSGDHDELVLLESRPPLLGDVAVRMRIGVVVDVRVPGLVVRRLALRGLRVRSAGAARVLELLVANEGNVTEEVTRGAMVVSLLRGRQELATLRPTPRELLPHSAGVVEFRYAGSVRGGVTAVVDVRPQRTERAPVRRAFRIRV